MQKIKVFTAIFRSFNLKNIKSNFNLTKTADICIKIISLQLSSKRGTIVKTLSKK